MSRVQLPVVSWNAGEREFTDVVVAALSAEVGFLLIKDLPITPGQLEALHRVIVADLARPIGQLIGDFRLDIFGQRGFVPPGYEMAFGHTKADAKMYRMLLAWLDNASEAESRYGANMWPTIPGYRQGITPVMNLQAAIFRRCLQALERGYGLQPGEIVGREKRAENIQRPILYQEEGTYIETARILLRDFRHHLNDHLIAIYEHILAHGIEGMVPSAPHLDINVLTVLPPAGGSHGGTGLEVYYQDQWLSAGTIPGMFTVQRGEMLPTVHPAFSGLGSSWHRVAYHASRPPGWMRTIAPFFGHFGDPDYLEKFDRRILHLTGVEVEEDARIMIPPH